MLTWNVFEYDVNGKKIRVCNIFDHHGFWADCKKAKRKHKEDKEAFAEDVRMSLMYYFWAKCEHEVIITSWPPRNDTYRKVDVYSQVMLNWPIFIDWLWEHRKELK